MATERQTGKIKKLVRERGFGFITGDDGVDRFFHNSTTTDYDRLEEGDAVSFTHDEGKGRGPRAIDVA